MFPCSSHVCLKQHADHERPRRDPAKHENALLKQRLTDLVKFEAEVKRLLLKHQPELVAGGRFDTAGVTLVVRTRANSRA